MRKCLCNLTASNERKEVAAGQEANARVRQREWVVERLTVWADRRLAVLVLSDMLLVSPPDAHSLL